jgi:hypothetical protein
MVIHIASMRIQIQIQGFDDQKLEIYSLKKIVFLNQRLQFTYP